MARTDTSVVLKQAYYVIDKSIIAARTDTSVVLKQFIEIAEKLKPIARTDTSVVLKPHITHFKANLGKLEPTQALY